MLCLFLSPGTLCFGPAFERTSFFSSPRAPFSALIAPASASTSDRGSGSAKNSRSGGSTSGTPPTLVATTRHPAHAASKMAIQKDSVKEQFRKIRARFNTLAMFPCGLRSGKQSVSPFFGRVLDVYWTMAWSTGRVIGRNSPYAKGPNRHRRVRGKKVCRI